MPVFIKRIVGVYKNKIDVLKSIMYTIKWPSENGLFVVTRKTKIDCNIGNLHRTGDVRIGCPKGIFGRIAIPGDRSTLIKIDRNGQLYLQNNVNLYAGVRIIISGTGKVSIGTNSSIASNTYLLSTKEIRIGDNCAISWDCQILDTDFHEVVTEDCYVSKPSPVVIGNHVLICSKVTILKGVRIGDNAVIAANSVVTKDVPSGCIAAGNPARIIKKNVYWV